MSLGLFGRYGSFFDDFNHYGTSVGPAVQFSEDDAALYLEMEVPRYHPEDITVNVDGHKLFITGRRAVQDAAYQFLFGEAPSNTFQRALRIPHGFDMSQVSQSMEHGVLTIKIPRLPAPPAIEPVPIVVAQSATPAVDSQGALTTTNRQGLTVTSTSSPKEFAAVAHMTWPPKVAVDDRDDQLSYVVTMPPSVTRDHVDLTLVGNNLRMGVNHRRQVVKKDRDGNTVFNEDQSVSYSTGLRVPQGTLAQDISTDLADGRLTIKVSKHANPQQNVEVKNDRQ